MTQTQIIQRFLAHIRVCLANDHIHPLYYGLSYWEHTDHYLNYMNFFRRLILQRYLQRYHERVFCYELYHKLRIQMDQDQDDENNNVYAPGNIYLQSEVKKMEIDQFVENIFRISRLSGEFMPDFLLHTPGNFENQLIVMEVKSTPKLNFALLREDLLKIQEFINNYGYLKGIFIAVNVRDELRTRLTAQLSQWHFENINTPAQITVFFKYKPESALHEFSLNNIPVI